MALTKIIYNRYLDWKKNIYPNEEKLYKYLAKNGQKPKAMIISCCDSRVNPTNIFKGEPGDYFIYRNIANLVPPKSLNKNSDSTLAFIEYGVNVLKIEDLIILGHSNCGGIKHAHSIFSKEIKTNDSNVDNWIDHIRPAYQKLDKDQDKNQCLKSLEQLSILNSISNLINSPEINELILNKRLNIHGVWFDIESGKIKYLDEKTGKFENVY